MSSPILRRLLKLAAVLLAATWPAGAQEAATTDAEPRLPDLRVLPPSDLHAVGSRAEGTLRLKFTTIIWNDGDGPVEVRGAVDEASGELEVFQFLHYSDGEVRRDRHVGRFNHAHRHGHLHLEGLARYRLWAVDANGRRAELAVENPKVGFCLMDNLVVDASRAPSEPIYGGCEAEVQGVSVGFGDEYVAELFEQDLPIAELPDGRYRLQNEANVGTGLRELDPRNNGASVDLVLEGDRVRPLDEP